MTRLICWTALIVIAVSTTTTRGQNNVAGSTITDALNATGTAVRPGTVIKQELRTGFAQLVANLIETLVADTRTALGLPAGSANTAIDPLSILQTILIDAANARILQTQPSE